MKKIRLSIIIFFVAMFSSLLNATTVYDDGNASKWVIYDNNPAGAEVKSVTDSIKGNVIEFSGDGIKNGYRLGNSFGKEGAWRDTTEFSLSWSMNFSDSYAIYVRVQTESGYRYLYYTKSNKDLGRKGSYLHHGLGDNSGWQDIIRDLEADLQDYEPYNKITSVNAFLVRGDGRIDDIKSFVTPNKSWLNYSAYELYEDAQNGDIAGWTIYDSDPLGATIENVFDEDKSSRVIELKSTDSYRNGIRNGYRLGNDFGKDGAWNNSDMSNINWSMKFDGEYYIFVSVQTDLGHRYLYYTNSDTNLGKVYNYYIHHGLGTNDGWQEVTRDLQADLKEYEPDNNITSVNAFLVRGNGRVDDIFLFSEDENAVVIVENIDISVADASVKEGDEGITDLNFTVTLSENALDESLIFDYNVTSATADDSDYNSTSGELTISSGKTEGIITVKVYGDKDIEGNETLSVAVTPKNSDIFNQPYAVATGTIINDDFPEANKAPIAYDINVTVDEDTNVTIELNASDEENSDLTFIIQSNPTNGTLSGEAPSLVYTPVTDFAGSDSFTYLVNDGELNSSIATVNITVTNVNDAPEIRVKDLNISVSEDNSSIVIDLSENVIDKDNDILTYKIISKNPEDANLVLDGSKVRFIPEPPPAIFNTGPVSFVYSVSDGNSTELNATVTLNFGDNESDNGGNENTNTRNFTIETISDATIEENSAYTSVAPTLNGDEPIGTVTYALGGDDADKFTISSTGVVSMIARDYENPVDADKNNVYSITVIATDEAKNSVSKAVNVTITDVDDSAIAQNDINLIADYRFDESSWNGNQVIDSSGNNLDGIAKNGASIGAGKVNQGASFDGIDDYIDMGDVLSPGETDKVTISMWFKLDSDASTAVSNVIFSKEAIYMAEIKDNYFRYAIEPHWYFVGDTSFPVTAGEWTHAVLTYDGKKQKLYKNGVLVYERAQTGNIGNNNEPFTIGAFKTKSMSDVRFPFNGNIDEVKVFSGVLTSEQVKDLYDSENNN